MTWEFSSFCDQPAPFSLPFPSPPSDGIPMCSKPAHAPEPGSGELTSPAVMPLFPHPSSSTAMHYCQERQLWSWFTCSTRQPTRCDKGGLTDLAAQSGKRPFSMISLNIPPTQLYKRHLQCTLTTLLFLQQALPWTCFLHTSLHCLPLSKSLPVSLTSSLVASRNT